MNLFSFTANRDGYIIFYKGKPIGGAGVKLPRENPLRGKQAQHNVRGFTQNATDEIHALEQGRGQARFRDVMAKIDEDKGYMTYREVQQ